MFQSASPRRWKAFIWAVRITALLLFLSIFTICVALFKNSNPQLPRLHNLADNFKPLLKPDKPLNFSRPYHKNKKHKNGNAEVPDSLQVRAGFYVNWDLQSYFSLKNNIGKMNMVLPEWLFVDPSADSIVVQIDEKAFQLLDSSSVKIVPLLSNYYNNNWNHETITRIVESPEKTAKFIHQLTGICQKYRFDGVSIDFEDLYSLKDDQHLVNFHHQLYDSLHMHGLLATQCIPPHNEDYRINDLEKFNDYIFVMAYDQHSSTTTPGPVSDVKWVEEVLDIFTDKIAPNKFILCLAGYGYDWVHGGMGSDVTFQEAVALAREYKSFIQFNNNSYNVSFRYNDDQNRAHEVWFADAATNFNIMQMASAYHLAGVSIWRLGSEDPRVWSYYGNIDLDSVKLPTPDLTSMSNIQKSTDIDYIGEGEILDVVSTPKDGHIKIDYDPKQGLITEENYTELPSEFIIKKYGKPQGKVVVLTFDDGPDPVYTPQILDILKKENVPATFFMIGRNIENNIPLAKRVFDEGYEIGNHTFSHPNLAEVSSTRSLLEINSTRRLIEIVTGHSTVLFRPPYNADAEPQTLADIIPVEQSREKNYLTVGESIDPQDWDIHSNSDTIYNRVLRQLNLGSIILLHDAGGNRSATVEALPRLIKYFKANGYQFSTVAQLIGQKKEDLMPPVTAANEKLLDSANFVIADFAYRLGKLLNIVFIAGIIMAIARTLFIIILASIQKRKEKKANAPAITPAVSIIVPAFNESVNAVNTIKNLLAVDYPLFEIIFVDDGSRDNTFELVEKEFSHNNAVKLFSKKNGGKASALNYGIERAQYDFVICIDADTRLLPDAVLKLMQGFGNEETVAVAGNVKVANPVNMLTNWQSIEYITAQNFDRRAYDLLNCITVVPGAIGAFRKNKIKEAGGFTTDTLAEDCDITVRLLKNGGIVRNNTEAVAYTEVPETVAQFVKQRFRWSFGVMQTFWKNRETLFNARYKWLGLFAMPNILFFQILLPLFAPLADVLMLIGLFSGNFHRIVVFYLLFQGVDLAGAVLAFSFEKASMRNLWMLIPQRFIYRWIMYYVFFKAILKAVKGEIQSWGNLNRTGNFKAFST